MRHAENVFYHSFTAKIKHPRYKVPKFNHPISTQNRQIIPTPKYPDLRYCPFERKKPHLFWFLMNNIFLYWQILGRFVHQCMIAASEKRFESIAFPAIGTGVLNFPPSVVAKVMFETVTLFKNQCPDCSLKKVEFVIYPKDTAAVEVCLNFIQ